jgi:hypothetical protein
MWRRTAHRYYLAAVKNTHEFHLYHGREVRDLVDEQRAAISHGDQSWHDIAVRSGNPKQRGGELVPGKGGN